ncbi:MAG TPA: hypothetical protein VGS12_04695 [Caulobacteraceae bacterium]|nr:hypothetical protein [Caulobacteraceae bacterium]
MTNQAATAELEQRRAILYMAWGERHLAEGVRAAAESRLPPYPVFIITDEITAAPDDLGAAQLIRAPIGDAGKAAKLQLFDLAPKGFDSILFLDVDTRVLGDISLGFEKAEQHGMALAQATHYSLADFRNFRRVMEAEGVPARGQLLYNSGVVFFAPGRGDVAEVFALAQELLRRHPDAPWGDQTYLSLAMEMLGFNPYTLSSAFNHRAFGELISGEVKIWHSYRPVPAGLAEMEAGWLYRCENGAPVKALEVPT